ncbi:hypothetical protein ACET3X_002553 [Alternaria dauci]|uniref:Uncharacterized protein n=1 Tax=Alternaria dauci TaxID=48095 RepID=A0ABR3USX1_9PLEO
MDAQFIPLSDFRIPDYPDAALHLDGSPLSVVDTASLTPDTPKILTPAIGLATVLYKWHPSALAAFLDLDAWFSVTWMLGITEGTPHGSKIEIGRITNHITFGILDSIGEKWRLMLTYDIGLEGENRGKWIPNLKESMLGDRELTDPEEIEKLAYICTMSLEDRGQAIKVSEKGGLIKWDVERMYAKEEGEMSENPNFEIPQEWRRKAD